MRHLGIWGNAYSEDIKAQNALVARLVYLLVLALKRGVLFIVEQPKSSVMWQHPRMQHFIEYMGDALFIWDKY
jgi:hypothetical protein